MKDDAYDIRHGKQSVGAGAGLGGPVVSFEARIRQLRRQGVSEAKIARGLLLKATTVDRIAELMGTTSERVRELVEQANTVAVVRAKEQA